MTNQTIPITGDLRVCVIAAPGHIVSIPVPDAKTALDVRDFSTASSTIARAHGVGGEFPSDAFVQRFNGRVWAVVPAVTDACPWRVVTVQGVFRFAQKEVAVEFAGPNDVVEFAPDPELARL